MKISELVNIAQRHLIRYGDGDVCAETRAEVLDVTKADADMFEVGADYSLVLVLDDDNVR